VLHDGAGADVAGCCFTARHAADELVLAKRSLLATLCVQEGILYCSLSLDWIGHCMFFSLSLLQCAEQQQQLLPHCFTRQHWVVNEKALCLTKFGLRHPECVPEQQHHPDHLPSAWLTRVPCYEQAGDNPCIGG
jgi:hypothetical protein